MSDQTLLLLGAVVVGWWLRGRRSRPPVYGPAPGWGAAAPRSAPSAKTVMVGIVLISAFLAGIGQVLPADGKTRSGSGPKLGSIFGAFGNAAPKFKLPRIGSGGGACPVHGRVRFSDTWGAPRSGGRSHKGVDMMAALGTPLVAVTDARVVRAGWNSLGGLGITLRDAKGTSYYYAHNSRNYVRAGQKVKRGQLIGRVGKTGNARTTAPHLHFEVRPGGTATNPTPYVRRWC